MCEILLIAQDNPNPDPIVDTKRYKLGDVVVALPDGTNWGNEELHNPFFRVVKLPNIPLEEAQAFLGEQQNSDPANPSRMLQRRAYGLDIASLPKAVLDWWNDSSRAAPTFTANVTVAQLRALKKLKPVIPDPDVLGDETPNVL